MNGCQATNFDFLFINSYLILALSEFFLHGNSNPICPLSQINSIYVQLLFSLNSFPEYFPVFMVLQPPDSKGKNLIFCSAFL